MCPWEGRARGSCHRRGKPCKILHETKVQHTPPSLSPHTSVYKPQKLNLRKGVYPGDTFPSPPVEARVGLTRWVLRSRAPLERAVGGAPGLPRLPTRGDSSQLLGDLSLAEDLQELGPWEEARQGRVCVYESGRAPLTSWVVDTRGVPGTLPCVGEFDNLGEVGAQRCRDGLVCGPGRRSSLLLLGDPRPLGNDGDEDTPHPQAPGGPADGGTRRSSVFTFCLVLPSLALCVNVIR